MSAASRSSRPNDRSAWSRSRTSPAVPRRQHSWLISVSRRRTIEASGDSRGAALEHLHQPVVPADMLRLTPEMQTDLERARRGSSTTEALRSDPCMAWPVVASPEYSAPERAPKLKPTVRGRHQYNAPVA